MDDRQLGGMGMQVSGELGVVLGAPYHRETIPSPSASAEGHKGTPKKKGCEGTQEMLGLSRKRRGGGGGAFEPKCAAEKPALLRWCPERREEYKRSRM